MTTSRPRQYPTSGWVLNVSLNPNTTPVSSGSGSQDKGRCGLSSPFLGGWIVFCTFCGATGWILSALHQLNLTGYLIAFAIGLAALIVWWKKSGAQFCPAPCSKFRRRFRRFFPMSFLALAVLAILGGVIYPPNNYDALAYRVPRMLNWLADGQWNWVHTIFHRLNTRASGVEWTSLPFIVFTNTDRWLFLINAVCYLMMPSVVFTVLRGLGVRMRAAWVWMWLLPTGYCYLLQAGSIGNDLFGALLPLMALHFAFRAVRSRSMGDVALAILGAALTTSAKTSNLPLVLPVGLALLPCLRMMLRKPIALVCVLAISALVSFLPTAYFNWKYCGDWTGAKAENIAVGGGDVVLHCANNVVLLTLQNFCPPIFPIADKWNKAVNDHMPPALRERLKKTFTESGAYEWSMTVLQWEVTAGIGTGVSLLLLTGFFSRNKNRKTEPVLNSYRLLVFGGLALAFCVYLAEMGLSGVGRLAAPYYPFIAAACLLSHHQGSAVRRKWWQMLAGATLLLALLVLVINPPRPLWPANTILSHVPKEKVKGAVQMASDTYLANSERSQAFAPILAALPPDIHILGLVTFDDPETSLWRPFGSRKILHVLSTDTGVDLRQRGIKYIVIDPTTFEQHFTEPLDQWLGEVNGKLFATVPLQLKWSMGWHDWPIVELNDGSR